MAYAALLYLTHSLEHSLNCDSQYLILDEIQQISSLLEKASFLLDFLDHSSQKYSETIECLEDQIIDAAYEAANTIESHITHRVLEASAGYRVMSFLTFCHTLEKVIEEIDSIKKRVEKMEDESGLQDLQSRISSLDISSNPAASGIDRNNMVGFDDDMMEIKDRLTRGSLNLETVALVGMGGIGKSTLATKVYEDEFIAYHFYICAWVSVSQDYNVREILINVLGSMKRFKDIMHEKSDQELSEFLYKNLKGSRYLIVLDDVWDTEILDDLKRLLPKDKNGSRIMLTTRLEKVANYENSCSPHHMHFLRWDESWNLFRGNVFDKDFCPLELETIGKRIVQNCRRLPLAIVVIGGLLSKSIKTPDYWKNVAENLSSVMISNDEQFSKILSLSYKHLPHHLKGCFLYMAFCPENFNIRISKLFKLWAAEGLLKSVKSKSLKDVAEDYLFDLVDRNLVLVHQQSSKGKIKSCKIHDLLRDLCMREAERVKFFHVTNGDLHGYSKGVGPQRFLFHSQGAHDYIANCSPNLLMRSLINFGRHSHLNFYSDQNFRGFDLLNFRLFRVLEMYGNSLMFSSVMLELDNLRYLACTCRDVTFLQSLHRLRNLQTIIVRNTSGVYLELHIWKMPQLRHVLLNPLYLPDPPSAGAFIALEHLETLSKVYDFKLTLEILKRIPNLKKLSILYRSWHRSCGFYSLDNLVGLQKLESLKCTFSWLVRSTLKNIIFPVSLQKLTISGGNFQWKDMAIVGSLPNLQVLKLKKNAFYGQEWEPNEEEFLELKYLLLEDISLVQWRADNIHFPRLQHLVLHKCQFLNEIPSSIGEIPTLLSIKVVTCCDSVVTSAKQIQEEQRSFGNDGLQVQFELNTNDVHEMQHLHEGDDGYQNTYVNNPSSDPSFYRLKKTAREADRSSLIVAAFSRNINNMHWTVIEKASSMEANTTL